MFSICYMGSPTKYIKSPPAIYLYFLPYGQKKLISIKNKNFSMENNDGLFYIIKCSMWYFFNFSNILCPPFIIFLH